MKYLILCLTCIFNALLIAYIPQQSKAIYYYGDCNLERVHLDVPYIAQYDKKSCATTSVAMILSYYERLPVPLDKEEVWRLSGCDEALVSMFGNDMGALQRVATHYGYASEFLESMSISDVERLLASGIPVVLNIKVSAKGIIPCFYHAVLVTGYDLKKQVFFLNDPLCKEKATIRYSDLESCWTAWLMNPNGNFDRSGFVVFPKGFGLR